MKEFKDNIKKKLNESINKEEILDDYSDKSLNTELYAEYFPNYDKKGDNIVDYNILVSNKEYGVGFLMRNVKNPKNVSDKKLIDFFNKEETKYAKQFR